MWRGDMNNALDLGAAIVNGLIDASRQSIVGDANGLNIRALGNGLALATAMFCTIRTSGGHLNPAGAKKQKNVFFF